MLGNCPNSMIVENVWIGVTQHDRAYLEPIGFLKNVSDSFICLSTMEHEES